jgi:hypothetical protein
LPIQRKLLAAAAIAIIALLFLIPLFKGLNLVADDYYYYERIGRNILAGHGSTYDGVVRTNGYHPLWMCIVTIAVLLEKLTHAPAWEWSLLTCAVLTIAFSLILIRHAKSDAWFLTIGTLLTAIYGAYLGVIAMETSLLLFFSMLLFVRIQANEYSMDWNCGILLALCFLARIDSIVYFFPPIAYLSLRGSRRNLVRAVVPLLVTLIVYCLINEAYFGVPMPISGIAKSVTKLTGIHAATWTYFGGAESELLLILVGIMTLWMLYADKKQPDAGVRKTLVCLSIVGVLLYLTVNSIRSDWPIQTWYFYPVALHLMLLTCYAAPTRRDMFTVVLSRGALALCLIALVGMGFRDEREARRRQANIFAAQKLQQLLVHDPHAVLAMGDRAGIFGELLPNNRLVQLEGLVMDMQFLRKMRSASSIVPILREYGVDYYIATNPRTESKGCFTTWEPYRSNGDSFKVESKICAPVVADFTIQQGTRNVVFHMTGGLRPKTG